MAAPRRPSSKRSVVLVPAVAAFARTDAPPVRHGRYALVAHGGCSTRRSPAMAVSICAHSRRGTATSANWDRTCQPCRAILASILTSFFCGYGIDQRRASVKRANFRFWLTAEVTTTVR